MSSRSNVNERNFEFCYYTKISDVEMIMSMKVAEKIMSAKNVLNVNLQISSLKVLKYKFSFRLDKNVQFNKSLSYFHWHISWYSVSENRRINYKYFQVYHSLTFLPQRSRSHAWFLGFVLSAGLDGTYVISLVPECCLLWKHSSIGNTWKN